MTLAFMKSNQFGSVTDTERPLCPSPKTIEDPGSVIGGQPKEITEENPEKSSLKTLILIKDTKLLT